MVDLRAGQTSEEAVGTWRKDKEGAGPVTVETDADGKDGYKAQWLSRVMAR